jgi:hypothetical protein
MNLILRQIIGYQQGRKAVSATANPLLKKQLEDTQKDLNSILNKWNWDGESPKTATEFLNKFTLWVNEKIKLGNEVKALLQRKGVNNLSEIA